MRRTLVIAAVFGLGVCAEPARADWTCGGPADKAEFISPGVGIEPGVAFGGKIARISSCRGCAVLSSSSKIEWGDGTASDLIPTGEPADPNSVRADHTYAKAGTYNIKIVLDCKVNDNGIPRTNHVEGAGTIYVAEPQPSRQLEIQPTTIKAGQSATGKVLLFGAAHNGGTNVHLKSSLKEVVVPPIVTVPQGSSEATFQISTTPTTKAQRGTIAASPGKAKPNTVRIVLQP